MPKKQVPKARSKLNQNQLQLLKTIAQFKFITVDQIARLENKDRSTIYERLGRLENQELVMKYYQPYFKLRGTPASYYLSQSGRAALKAANLLPRSALKLRYRNINRKIVSYHQQVVNIYLVLKRRYEHDFDIYVQMEIQLKIPAVRLYPDFYLIRKTPSESAPNNFFIEVLRSNESIWRFKKRLSDLNDIEYDWPTEKLGKYPVLVFVTSSSASERPILWEVMHTYANFIDVLTTTAWRLLNPERTGANIYRAELEQDNFLSLDSPL